MVAVAGMSAAWDWCFVSLYHEHDGRRGVHVAGGRPDQFSVVDAGSSGSLCVAVARQLMWVLVVLAVGVDWLATVDDRATPWSVGAAASLAVFTPRWPRQCRPTGRNVDASNVPPLDPPMLRRDGCECWDVGRRSGYPRPTE